MLRVLPRAVKSLFRVAHDTLEVPFSTQSEDHYGSLIVGFRKIDKNFILRLLEPSDEEEPVIREKYSQDIKKGTARFGYLEPQKYVIKLIYDPNNNKKWDTGNYLKNVQPEKVIYHPDTFDVRSNWEYEVEWNINE